MELVGRMKEAGQPDDLIRREDAVNAIRDACIRKHIPFSSNSPEGKRTLEAIWAVYTAPAAIPAAELGAANVYDRLRELLKADREGRCFVFLVRPDRSEVVICEDGEAWTQEVYEVDVGRNSAGEMNCIYLTVDGSDFETADIERTVFLPDETEKIEAALAKMQEETQDDL